MNGKVDCIVLTGGLAYDASLTSSINERVRFIAPVRVCPEEDEMYAMVESVYKVFNGEFEVQDY